MCWNTNKNPIKQIAESDLKVYKILKCRRNHIISPIIIDFVWELNRTYETKLDSPNYYVCGKRINTITHGFHSLLEPPKVHMQFYYKQWHTKGCCDIMYYDIGEHVFEAVIPKGSEYYENEKGEIVSNQLKIIRKYA